MEQRYLVWDELEIDEQDAVVQYGYDDVHAATWYAAHRGPARPEEYLESRAIMVRSPNGMVRRHHVQVEMRPTFDVIEIDMVTEPAHK